MTTVPFQDFFYLLNRGSSSTTGRPVREVSASTRNDDGGTVLLLAKLCGGGISGHLNISSLIQNLLPYRTGYIIGHGEPGSFETGDGQLGYPTAEGTISLKNLHIWKEEIEKLWTPTIVAYDARHNPHNSFGQIMIMACSVAGNLKGLELIQKISDLTNRIVNASTGLIYVSSDGYYIENGHRYIRVFPTGSIHDDISPQKILNNINPSLPIKLLHNGNMKSVGFMAGMEYDDVESVKIKTRINGILQEREFPPEIASSLYKELFYSKPFQKNGGVTGLVTAFFIVNFRNQSPLIVNVFADGIAETNQGGSSFIISRNFRQFIELLFCD